VLIPVNGSSGQQSLVGGMLSYGDLLAEVLNTREKCVGGCISVYLHDIKSGMLLASHNETEPLLVRVAVLALGWSRTVNEMTNLGTRPLQPGNDELTVTAEYMMLDRPLRLTIVREDYQNPWLAILLLITMILYVARSFFC
jgi:hypothetical protein